MTTDADDNLLRLQGENRRPLIVMVGIGQIVLGCLILGLVLVGLAGTILLSRFSAALAATPSGPPPPAPIPLAAVLPGLVMIFAGGVAIIVLGANIIRMRHWARSISLCIYGLWIVVGLVFLIVGFANLSGVMDKSLGSSGISPRPGVIEFIMILVLTVSVLIYVAIPGAIMAGLLAPNVRRTMLFYNPQPDWTERCPILVLAMAVYCAGQALMELAPLLMARQLLFGVIISGLPALVLTVVEAGVWAYLARGLTRLDPKALYGAIAYLLLSGGSTVYSFLVLDAAELLRGLGFDEAYIDQSVSLGGNNFHNQALSNGLSTLLAIGMLIYLSRHFRRPAPDRLPPEQPEPPPDVDPA